MHRAQWNKDLLSSQQEAEALRLRGGRTPSTGQDALLLKRRQRNWMSRLRKGRKTGNSGGDQDSVSLRSLGTPTLTKAEQQLYHHRNPPRELVAVHPCCGCPVPHWPGTDTWGSLKLEGHVDLGSGVPVRGLHMPLVSCGPG